MGADVGGRQQDRRSESWTRVEISTLGAALFALTYVSGYLTSTAYLGTYDIAANASELLRPKYIYIGSEYWMCIAAFGNTFYWIRILLDSIKRSERKYTLADILRIGTYARPRYERWLGTVAAIIIVFSCELLLLIPGDFRPFLGLQSIFLLTLCLSQATYYRELAKESYDWSILYGHQLVDTIRWACFGVAVVVAGIIGFQLYDPRLETAFKIFAASPFGIAVLFGIILGVTFVSLLISMPSQWLSRLCGYSRVSYRDVPLRKQFRSLLALFPTYYALVSIDMLIGNDRHIIIVQYGTFILALVALTNILWLTRLMVDREVVLRMATTAVSMRTDSDLPQSDRDKGSSTVPIISRATRIRLRGRNSLSARLQRAVAVGLPAAVLYVVSVFGFAYLVYPHIPVQKAGGNYATAKPVTITVVNSAPGGDCNSQELVDEVAVEKCFVVLDSDSEVIYFAPRYGKQAGGGPDCWRWGALCTDADRRHSIRPSSGICANRLAGVRGDYPLLVTGTEFRPKIYAINRRCIASVNTVE